MPLTVPVDAATVRLAESQIESCEECNPDAVIPFDWIVDRITGHGPNEVLYVLELPAKCPKCKRPVNGRTLVEWGSPE